ncbi:hypothetical protein QR680_015671 [Steinernema hermaphroditum]|uniref:C-type lectin domain-containing protein n=1 Tax=Steinernema hermaphroditum TaxID=289476 RepID=A0AA39LLB2_9BILA|nr:hypothetical protein QR680_015671 [Steinernema hermaphroditum]
MLLRLFGLLVTLTICVFSQNADIVVVLDGSKGVGPNSFHTEKSLLGSLLKRMSSSSSSVAVISAGHTIKTISNFTNIDEASRLIKSIGYDGTDMVDTAMALRESEALIAARAVGSSKKAVILFTTFDLRCPETHLTAASPCREAARLIRKNISIIAVTPQFHDTIWPMVNITEPVFVLRTDSQLYERFDRALGLIGIRQEENIKNTHILNANKPINAAPKFDAELQPCSEDFSQVWIDLVVILDSTLGVGSNSFHTLRSSTSAMIGLLTIGQADYQTRVAVINMGESAHVLADFSTYSTTAEAKHGISKAPFLGDNTPNLEVALTTAKKMLDGSTVAGRQQVVLLWTSQHVKCQSKEVDSPCRAAHDLTASGIQLVTIDAVFHDAPGHLSTLTDSCNSFRSDDIQLTQEVLKRAAIANCHCSSTGWYIFRDGCAVYRTCVYQVEMAMDYDAAAENCDSFGGRLVSVHSQDKNSLLTLIATKNSKTEGFIGLKFGADPIRTSWADGSEFDIYRSYNRFDGTQPTPFSCTNFEKFGNWGPAQCSAAKYSFCERFACDAELHECDP